MKTIVTFFAFTSAFLSHAFALPPESETRWREDIDAYVQGLEEGHIDLFHTVSRANFFAATEGLKEQLTQLSEPEIIARLMLLTHSIGDGHTSIPLWGSGYRRFPIEIRWIGGQAIVTGTSQEQESLLGGRLVSWDGIEAEETYRMLAPYVPFVENEHSEAVRVAAYLPISELGVAVGLTRSAAAVTLEVEVEGRTQTISLESVASDEFDETVNQRISYRVNLPDDSDAIVAEGIRFAFINGGELGYIQFDRYPSHEDMRSFSDDVYEELVRSEVRNLVIDFRENFGGNYFVGLILASDLVAIDSLDWQRGIYVLTSGTTFSAAMSNSAQYADILHARLVGEPTGANPCGYQDLGQFTLPNSGLLVTYSKRRYCFADAVDGALAPDVPIAIQPSDYSEGRDRAMDWIMEGITSHRLQ